MRILLALLFVLSLGVAPVRAEDEKGEPKQPEQSKEERAALIAKAQALSRKLTALFRAGKYGEAEPVARESLELRIKLLGPEHPQVANAISSLGGVLKEAGKLLEAKEQFERALAIYEKIKGPDDVEVANALNNVGFVLQALAQNEEALALYRRALAIWEKHHGKEHADVATALNNIALAFYGLGKYDETLSYLDRALDMRKKTLGAKHPMVGQGHANMAAILELVGRPKEALPHMLHAVEVTKASRGPTHPVVGMQMGSLAMLLAKLDRRKEALPLAEQGLKLVRDALGPKHPEVARSQQVLADLYAGLSRFEESYDLQRKALAALEASLPADHPRIAQSLKTTGNALERTGRARDARVLFERALGIHERIHGPKHPQYASALNDFGALLLALGEHDEARSAMEHALRIQEDVHGRQHHEVATALSNLALCLSDMGLTDQAAPLFKRSLAIQEKKYGKDAPQLAATINNYALLLRQIGDNEAALPLLERSVRLRERAEPKNPVAIYIGLLSLASALDDMGQPKKALPMLERAVALAEKAYGPGHPDFAKGLAHYGLLLQDQGRPKEALTQLERALAIIETSYGPDHPLAGEASFNLAGPHLILKQDAEAERYFRRALDISERTLRNAFAGLQPSERYAMSRFVRRDLGDWLRFSPRLGHDGYAQVLRLKGLVARATAADRRLARRGGAHANARLAEVHVAANRLAKLANGMPAFRLKEKRAAWQEAYAKAAGERARLEVALARDFAPLREGNERLDLGLTEIQARLGKGRVLVDFLRTGDRYLAWIVRAEGKPVRVDLGPAVKIDAAVAALAEQVADAEEKDWGKPARAVRDLVLAPLLRKLGAQDGTLVLCPDGALTTLPFAALPGAKPGTSLGAQFLLEHVVAAQDLVPWNATRTSGQGALLLGGVDYRSASGPTTDAAAERPPEDAPRHRAPRGRAFVSLPGTKAEAAAIAGLLGASTRTLSGSQATEAALRDGVRGVRFLHLATHGFVREDLMRGLARRSSAREWLGADAERQLGRGHDPMLLAGLALAGANTRRGGTGDDGILTALEASQLDLDSVDLVVLSACQTALGTTEAGEGVVGLVQGFQMAGAGRVMGSLWRVDDDATQALMVRFYELWQPKGGKAGLAASEALRRAQAHVRAQSRWKHPYYWAAWVLWGAAR